ncbi:MAG TPA: Crp/Fnr family transcriptional regulator [Thiomicrospira sp.]|jgi:CRP/FNR family transcriptional regulator|nr:Crp/Fnr family transcriptional regulator [Thiomicrospira sp.]
MQNSAKELFDNLKDTPVFRSSCGSCGLQKLCFANGLTPKDLAKLDSLVEKKTSLVKGEYLYKKGEVLQSFFAVKSGMVKVYSISENREENIHGFYQTGDILGLDALAYNEHPFSAVALDDSSVCEIPFEELTSLAGNVPNLNGQLLHLMSQEIVNSRRHSSLLTQKTAEQKIAYFILFKALKLKSRGYLHTQFRLSILHKDVANYLSLTPETISRILTKFNKENIVSWQKKEVNIFDESKLGELAGDRFNECN